MTAKSDIVSYWFAEQMASGPLARDDAAHQQAIDAKDDLVQRLEGAQGADAEAEAVGAWFVEKIATGPLARNTVAYNQAFAAKDDLIARLAAAEPADAAIPPKAASKASKGAGAGQPETDQGG